MGWGSRAKAGQPSWGASRPGTQEGTGNNTCWKVSTTAYSAPTPLAALGEQEGSTDPGEGPLPPAMSRQCPVQA